MKYKIIISPSKNMNLNANVVSVKSKRPIYIKKAKALFAIIKGLNLTQTKALYKLSDKKSLAVYNMHKKHGKKLFYAIELYDGLFYKYLNFTKENKKWLQDHVIILDALYGIIKPFDTIGAYRLDFKVKFPIDIKKFWKDDINKYFSEYKVYNLASKEFSALINKKILNVPLSGQGNIKIQRANALNEFKK